MRHSQFTRTILLVGRHSHMHVHFAGYNPPLGHHLSEGLFRDLSQRLGSEWRKLGTYLGLDYSRIEILQEQYPNLEVRNIYTKYFLSNNDRFDIYTLCMSRKLFRFQLPNNSGITRIFSHSHKSHPILLQHYTSHKFSSRTTDVNW